MMYMIYIPLLLITAAAAGLILNTIRDRRKNRPIIEPLPFELSVRTVDKLKEALTIKSVSHSDYSRNDMNEFRKILPFIEKNYPLVSKKLKPEQLNDYSCIILWPGKNETLKPVLLISHFDVVPADPEEWRYDPFGGEEHGGFIWGRGTLDTKNTLTAILESAEVLLEQGFQPERTLWIAFGGDEETQGAEGAGKINRYFLKRGIEFEWLLDEGGVVAEGAISLVKEPLALIGISEKGFMNVSLTAAGKGGHSSMPPRHSSAGLLSRAVCTVENHPFPARLTPTVRSFLHGITPYVSFPVALVLANQKLFSSVIKKLLLQGDQTAALVRTTQAVTVLRSGEKENVLPSWGKAVVNLRILPGETSETALSRLKKVLKDSDILVESLEGQVTNDPIDESPMDHEAYTLISSVIHGVFPDAVTVPYMMTGGTDSKHYREVCPRIYRFSPMKLSGEEIGLIHSADERISRENYGRAVQFFMTLMSRI